MKERTLSISDDPELLIITLDTEAPEDLLQSLKEGVKFVRILNFDGLLKPVEKCLIPELKKGRVKRRTRRDVTKALNQALSMTVNSIEAVSDSTHVIVITPAYCDREEIAVNISMRTARHIQAIGRG